MGEHPIRWLSKPRYSRLESLPNALLLIALLQGKWMHAVVAFVMLLVAGLISDGMYRSRLGGGSVEAKSTQARP